MTWQVWSVSCDLKEHVINWCRVNDVDVKIEQDTVEIPVFNGIIQRFPGRRIVELTTTTDIQVTALKLMLGDDMFCISEKFDYGVIDR